MREVPDNQNNLVLPQQGTDYLET